MAARRILLVEDSLAWRSRIAALLLDEGYHVATAAQAKEGLANCREQIPELVLSEYELPRIDASTFFRKFTQEKWLRRFSSLPAFRTMPVEPRGVRLAQSRVARA